MAVRLATKNGACPNIVQVAIARWIFLCNILVHTVDTIVHVKSSNDIVLEISLN